MVDVDISFASNILPQDVRGRATRKRLRRETHGSCGHFLEKHCIASR